MTERKLRAHKKCIPSVFVRFSNDKQRKITFQTEEENSIDFFLFFIMQSCCFVKLIKINEKH